MSGDTIYWPRVCGNRSIQDALWSPELTVSTTDPDFTQCFQATVLVWIPCGLLWLCSAVYLPWLCARPRRHPPCRASPLNAAKVTLGCLLCAVSVVEVVYVYVTDSDLPPSLLARPVIQLISYMLATCLVGYEYQKGVHTGGVLFFFWLLSVVTGIVPFRSLLKDLRKEGDVEDLLMICTFYVGFIMLVLQLILVLFANKSALQVAARATGERRPLLESVEKSRDDATIATQKKKPCPEESCSFFSRITFSWITPLIFHGYKNPIKFDDLTDILAEDKSSAIQPEFENQWQKQLDKTHFRLLAADREEEEVHYRGRKPKQPSFWSAIIGTFGMYYACAGIFKLIYDLISFASPVILSLLITYIGSDSPYVWQGYLYAVLLFVVAMVRTIAIQQYWDMCFRTGLRLRTAVTGTIYRKALRLNSTAKKDSTVGQIVNLMSVDAQKLQDAPAYMHMVWSTPLTIVLATYFLWQQVGPSVLAGVGIMFLLIPVNGAIAAKSRKLQVSQMKYKDSRIKLMNEILNGIKVLKLYAWEGSFKDRVVDIREDELGVLRTSMYLTAISGISWFMTPYLVALGTFAVYVLSSPDHVLDANKAFVSLSLFNLLNYPMSILPAVLMYGIQAAVSIGRIEKFLKNEEVDPDSVTRDPTAVNAVQMEDSSLAWERGEDPILRNINLRVTPGQLVAVVGQVGSGKSSLLSAILGDMERLRGNITVKSSLAYVPQQAWIQNQTVKDNILFGRSYSRQRYQKVLEACALVPDLKILPGGDMTEIGEKGINLSGGQKQRVSLARAVYQDEDIYLLDDPLSAVDSHVGKHIFEQVIGPNGLLRHKTRVLVTNSLTYLREMDMIVVLRGGEISELGSFDELISHQGAFAEFIVTYLNELESSGEENGSEMKKELIRQISTLAATAASDSEAEMLRSLSERGSTKSASSRRKKRRQSKSKHSDQLSPKRKSMTDEAKPQTIQRLTEEEVAMTGSVSMSVFVSYVRACGPCTVFVAFLFYMLTLAANIATNIWLSHWSNDNATVNGTQDTALRDLRLGVYGGLGCVQGIAVIGQGLTMAMGCILACRVLHTSLLSSVLRAPMSFFDTTPLGRIINRFSRDVDILDVNIPMTIRIWLGTFSAVATTLVVISYSTPIFLAVCVPLGLFYYFAQRFYIRTSRQIKRLDSIQRSPIYAHFSETVSGAPSIRAYRKQLEFIQRADSLVDRSQITYFPSITCNRWIGLWLEFIGNVIVLFAGIFAVLGKDAINPGLAGLSVSYALQVTGALNMVVRMTSDMETYIVAVERIKEYTECPQEAPAVVEGNRPSAYWPSHGEVVFDHYATRYRPGLDLVLRDVNCIIQPKQRVGIVGRTGAGKSSLTLALFRIIESAMGKIVIDDINISSIGLHDLRSKLTIIPQDPVLFSGTLRMNLDPFERHTDTEVWTSLKQAHLSDFVGELSAGLSFECTEGGENLSVGQRQLVCLARALLRKTKVLILDEATAAVDLETDDLIQTTIRTEFQDCTVITIAHRINTIMDYDRVMVLDKGQIVEFDSPGHLQENPQGVFFGMARDAGLIASSSVSPGDGGSLENSSSPVNDGSAGAEGGQGDVSPGAGQGSGSTVE